MLPLFSLLSFSSRGPGQRKPVPARPRVEELETRLVPSASGAQSLFAHPFAHAHPLGSGGAGLPAFYPSDIRTAYGITGISGNGAGQTIAIIDAYNDPNIKTDLTSFDNTFGLAAPPSFRVVNQTGGTRLPRNSPRGSWDIEESLDVEWAHAVAPGASIILVEANSPSFSDLVTASVGWARKQTGVSVISMSFGASEFSSETTYDASFKTPSGHAGVTFVASTGDNGAPGGYPAFSPNILAVGGTSLTLNSGANWVSETGWSLGGGGQSQFEAQPTYQNGVQSSGKRQMPDVAFDADSNTGVYVIDSYAGGAYQVGGTSLSAPCWGGLLAIANQLRVSGGLGTLKDTQAHSILYGLPSSDWHDITSGNNGFAAGPGYDLVTGIGSPIANLLVPALGAHPVSSAVVTPVTTGTSTNASGGGSFGGALAQVATSQNGLFADAAVSNKGTVTNVTTPLNLHGTHSDAAVIDALFAAANLQNGLLIGGL